jgi:hypothetical protein
VALNVVCCETAIRLESGAKQKCQARAQNVADDPNRKSCSFAKHLAYLVASSRGLTIVHFHAPDFATFKKAAGIGRPFLDTNPQILSPLSEI